MKPGISFWVQKNPDDGGFVGLTSYSNGLSWCSPTEIEALIGIIKVTLECLEITE